MKKVLLAPQKGSSNLFEVALQYQRMGLFILPLIRGEKRPYVKWGHRKDKKPDETELIEWWSRYPDAQIGMACGKCSGVDVVDFDNSDASMPHFESVVCDIPNTYMQNTGRLEGGKHYFFRHTEDDLKNIVKPKDKNGQTIDVDVRTTGGIVVLHPSIHKSGNRYQWGDLNPLEMDNWHDELQEMPEEMLKFFKSANNQDQAEEINHCQMDIEKILSGINKGERDIKLFKYCCRLRGKGLEYEEVKLMVINIAKNCNPPFQEEDAIQKLDQAWKYSPNFIESTEQNPLPLERDLDRSEPYPIDALGEVLGNVARKMNKVIMAPDALCAHAVLGFATHSIQSHANVEMDGRIIPLNEFFLSIGSRSSRKSECDSKAGLIHKKIQKDLLYQYQIVKTAFNDEKEAYEKEKCRILNDKKKSLSEKNNALAELRKIEPTSPYEPLMVFNDPTIEGIHGLFMNGTPSKYLCADEGGQVSGGHSMTPEKKTYAATTYSKYWDAAPIDRVRGGDGSSVLYGRRLSMHLMMQDKIAAEFFNDEVMKNQGFLSRFLCSFPESLTGQRPYHICDVSNTSEMVEFYRQVQKNLEEPLPLRIDGNTGFVFNELEPRNINLENDAKTEWINAYTAIEAESGKGRKFESTEGFAGKASNHIIRLAGIMAMFDDINRTTIPKCYIDNAIVLMEYYLKERLRLTKMADPNIAIENAKKLLNWIQEKGLKTVTLPDVYQFGPSRFRSKRQAQDSIKILEEHFWLVRLKEGGFSEISSKKSNIVWKTNKGRI